MIRGNPSFFGPDYNPNPDPVAAPGPTAFYGFHYGRLFRLNSGMGSETSLLRQPVPDMVGGYEITPDGLTYTMKLRPGVTFHPPLSRPLTSADVKASWDYFTTSSRNVNRDAYAHIVDSFATPDADTVVFTLKQPNAWFLNKLADPAYLWLLSQDAVAGSIDPQHVLAGTGPWIFDERTPTAYTWRRNPDYYLKGIPYADGVQLLIINDVAIAGSLFAAGKLDVLDAQPQTELEVLQKTAPGAAVHDHPLPNLSFLFFSDLQDPASPFKDPRLRQAASIAVDRQALIDVNFNGHGVWENIIPTGLGRWFLDPRGKDAGGSAKWFKQDLKTARQLIAAAGYADTELKLLYTNNAYGAGFNGTAESIARMLVDAGFKISPVVVDHVSAYRNDGRGIFFTGAPPNTIVYAIQTPFTDPDDYLVNMLLKDGKRNLEHVDDPNLASLVQRQQVELDGARRLQLVYEIQRLHAEQMYYPPMIFGSNYTFTQPWVQNVFLAADYNYGTEQYAYLSVNNR